MRMVFIHSRRGASIDENLQCVDGQQMNNYANATISEVDMLPVISDMECST